MLSLQIKQDKQGFTSRVGESLGESLSCVDAGDMCKEQLQSEAQPFDDLLCLVCIKGLESKSQLFDAGDFSCESPTSQSFPIIPNQHPVFHPCFIKDHHEMRRIEGQRRIRCRSHGPWSWDLRTSGPQDAGGAASKC